MSHEDNILSRIFISEPIDGSNYNLEEIINFLKIPFREIPEKVEEIISNFEYEIVLCPPKSPSFIMILAANTTLSLGYTYGKDIWVYVNNKDDFWLERMTFTLMHEVMEWSALRAPIMRIEPINELFSSLLGALVTRLPTFLPIVDRVIDIISENIIENAYSYEAIIDSIAIYSSILISKKLIKKAINRYLTGDLLGALETIVLGSNEKLRGALANYLTSFNNVLVAELGLIDYVSEEKIEIELPGLFVNENLLIALNQAYEIYRKMMEFDEETIEAMINKSKLISEQIWVTMLKRGEIITDILGNIAENLRTVKRCLEIKERFMLGS